MVSHYLKILSHQFHKNKCTATFPSDILNYLEKNRYPSNHAYQICYDELLPRKQLAFRAKKFASLYPEKLTSLLDLSCSKGYFVFDSSKRNTCERSLGIDIEPKNIEFCRELKRHLKRNNTQFELLTLDKLAENIDAYGGPYQTVLLINMYQYLFFGSDVSPIAYFSNEKILSYLNQICSDRIIFNNRIELGRCQNQTQVKKAGEAAKEYNLESFINAAEKYFKVILKGKIGKEPILVLKKKEQTYSLPANK